MPTRETMAVDVAAADAPDGWALTATAGSEGWGVQTEDQWLRLPVTDTALSGVAQVRAGTTPRDVTASLVWMNNNYEQVDITTGVPVTDSTSGWTTVEVTGTAPPGAVGARLRIETDTATPGETHLVDRAQICRAGDTCA